MHVLLFSVIQTNLYFVDQSQDIGPEDYIWACENASMMFTGNSGAQGISNLAFRKPTLVFDFPKMNPIWYGEDLSFAFSHLYREEVELNPKMEDGYFVPLAQNGNYQIQQGYNTVPLTKEELKEAFTIKIKENYYN